MTDARPGESTRDMAEPAADALLRIGSVAELVEQGRRTVTTAGRHQILALAVRGTIYALSNGCTHVGGRLPLDNGFVYAESAEIRCLWHAGRFSLATGEATARPCVVPLRTYEVIVRGDDVFVPMPVDPGPMPDPWEDE